MLHIAINRAYPEHKVRLHTVNQAIKSFIKLNRMMNDPKGVKKHRVRSIEQVLYKCAFISSMIPSDTIVKYTDPCNEKHAKWYNPWNPDIECSESIYDLMNKAMPSISLLEPITLDSPLRTLEMTKLTVPPVIEFCRCVNCFVYSFRNIAAFLAINLN